MRRLITVLYAKLILGCLPVEKLRIAYKIIRQLWNELFCLGYIFEIKILANRQSMLAQRRGKLAKYRNLSEKFRLFKQKLQLYLPNSHSSREY
ncbi:uncharacterized protein LOC133823330 isoform X2 [Humulus lupulus]|uniref:uncharacterized protein LOC133823330 isoform X2 n=1 Tax=Humulus lupulus TaxID=3486 RepID=UPI002B40E6AF|nr:uncharacterized protein LOC133823330 isoform X2 [Humulus lupulus]